MQVHAISCISQAYGGLFEQGEMLQMPESVFMFTFNISGSMQSVCTEPQG